jgi:hypothetical protein
VGNKRLQHPSHKHKTRSVVNGIVRESLSDKKWLVAFEDGTKRGMKRSEIYLLDVSIEVNAKPPPIESVEAQEEKEDEYKDDGGAMPAYTFLSPLFSTPQFSQDKVYSDNSNEIADDSEKDGEDGDKDVENSEEEDDGFNNEEEEDDDTLTNPSSLLSDLNTYELKLYHSNNKIKELIGKKIETVSDSGRQTEKVKWTVIGDSTPHELNLIARSNAYLSICSQDVSMLRS